MIKAFLLLLILPGIAQASPWAGRLTLQDAPAFGAWQSVSSADQALGFAKPLWHLQYDNQMMIRVAVFGGFYKPVVDTSEPVKVLGGLNFAVPGSLLDWALGTKWGDAWLPKLKTGVLGAYDLTRVKSLHLKPNFVGVGVAYPLGQ